MTRSILITGCSSGIGYDAALTLRERGWRVFAACRQVQDCARLRAEGFESPHIDYDDPATIHAGLAEVLNATGGTLDALFNNGAYGLPGAVEDLPTDAFRAIFETNFFGWHELTRAVIPVMRHQGHGRIIQCSSVLGIAVMRWRSAYNATKHALEGYTDTLRVEMRDTPVKVVSILPGPITTKFRENAIPRFERWVDWKSSVRADQYQSTIVKRLYKKNSGKDPFELGPEAVTAKLIHALESNRPRPKYFVTTLTHIISALRRFLPVRVTDWIIARL